MIIVKRITAKNFLSYGNAPTVFELDQHRSTLIRGKNGDGKSTILDLLMFGLYGNPYRKINKPQLVNSINKSGMLVEIEFMVNGVEYSVHRGIKPQVFDIFKEGILINQDAAVRDYQKFLETQILRVSEKTFKQIAVLGAASYVPFMQLSASQRRELIESILDIEIFSRMNNVLRDRMAASKEEFYRLERDVDVRKTRAQGQQKLINMMKNNAEIRVFEYQTEIDSIQATIEQDTSELQSLLATIVAPDDAAVVKYGELQNEIILVERDIKSLTKQLAAFHALTVCPTCHQEVGEDHKHKIESKIDTDVSGKRDQLQELSRRLVSATIERDVYTDALDAYHKQKMKAATLELAIKTNQSNVDALIAKIAEVQSNRGDLESETAKLKDLAAEALTLINRKNDLSAERQIQEVSLQLLKDTGIKTSVVRDYLPTLNQLINRYLCAFDFFVEFTLDENFNEVIKSRGRDTFSYSSFSEGEKRRIDLSILLAFRQLAAMKNSARTNLLIFDEILDSNLDLVAREQVNDIISKIEGANIIVISHADANADDFDRILLCSKNGDFSTVTEIQ